MEPRKTTKILVRILPGDDVFVSGENLSITYTPDGGLIIHDNKIIDPIIEEKIVFVSAPGHWEFCIRTENSRLRG